MNDIKKYYDNIQMRSSPEEMAGRVLKASAETATKKKALKKPAVLAAAAVFILGTTAAAVTIHFNDIFGGYITVRDEQLAEELMRCAEDVQWSTSDEDYEIVLKGVAGSRTDIVVRYDIVRTDGKPVKDFFVNLPEEGERLTAVFDIPAPKSGALGKLHSQQRPDYFYAGEETIITINDEGNISVYSRTVSTLDVSGITYTHKAINLYPKKLIEEFEKKHDVYLNEPNSDYPYPHFVYWGSNGEPAADLTAGDQSLIGLELEWSVELKYAPSEKALETKKMDYEGELGSIYFTHNGNGLATPVCTLGDSLFTCVGGWIGLDRSGVNLDFSISTEYNEIFLIKNDGTQVPAVIMGNGASSSSKGTYLGRVKYSDTADGEITVVDIAEIKAISINGTVYDLI